MDDLQTQIIEEQAELIKLQEEAILGLKTISEDYKEMFLFYRGLCKELRAKK